MVSPKILPLGRGGDAHVVATIPHDTKILLKHLRRVAGTGTTRCCYEAGPTGFTLCRELRTKGVQCTVIAPSLTPKQPGDRVKTDRRDAERLARFLRSGDLTEVHLPDANTEAIRDLERAREDAVKALGVARRQLGKFLLRNGQRFDGTTSWTTAHMDWICSRKFEGTLRPFYGTGSAHGELERPLEEQGSPRRIQVMR